MGILDKVMGRSTKAPVIGDGVLCDGQDHIITNVRQHYSSNTGERADLVVFDNPQRSVTGLFSDLRYDADLDLFYLWGRCLSKAQRVIVAELRDRNVLPARKTRTPGNVPAGGEHLNLWKSLFGPVKRQTGFWEQELGALRSGGVLSPEAQGMVADYQVRFDRKLTEGYAQPDVDDSREN